VTATLPNKAAGNHLSTLSMLNRTGAGCLGSNRNGWHSTPSALQCRRASRVLTAPRAGLPFGLSGWGAQPAKAHSTPQHTDKPEFELPLAVALAGSAFESYLEPSAGGVPELGINNSHVIYADRAFLAEVCRGLLSVQLVSASNLRKADITGKSDPYALLAVGASQGRSKVILQNLNPQWNENFLLYVRNPDQDFLQVRLYDKDMIGSDDDLGLVRIPLSTLKMMEQQELNLPLKGPGAQGQVLLRLKLMPFTAKVAETLTSSGIEPLEAEAPTQAKQKVITEEQAKQGGLLGELGKAREQVVKSLGSLGVLSGGQGGPSEEELAKLANNPWLVLAGMAGFDARQAWSPVAFANNEETDTQAWLYRSVKHRTAVIAFRGTEQVKWKDLATDLNLTPTELNTERINEAAGQPGLIRIFNAVIPSEQMMVHDGFLKAWDSLKPQVFRLLDAILASKGAGEGPWRVYITGHSLGGSLATLCAYELAARRQQNISISMYTFGAPRVGNKVFAAAFNALVPDSWRVTNSKDIIPTVPRLLGYAHVKHSVRLRDDGTIGIQPDDADIFGEGKGGLEVIQDLVTKAQAGETGKDGWEEVYEQIKAREMATLDSLVNGAALEQHMETFYLASLKAVVAANSKAA